MRPPLTSTDFERRYLGVDATGGRFADVSIDCCRHCGQRWLEYFYEIEAFSRSGRWYRGAITAAQAGAVTPETAPAVLAALPWHLYGGRHFDSTGSRRDAPLDPEAL
jgi:hypothetical protein